MDQRKKKQLNVPENKGLLHNFKFDLEIPFAPLAYPKTLYYQLDPERHTKPKMLNVEVKNMCSLFVSCDLGLAIDDLNMKPHIFNLQEETNDSNNMAQLHPDDLALINEDIVVSDTEEDEEILKHKQEQEMLEQKIKENQLQMMEKQRLQKENERVKDKEVDFTQNFDQLRIAISHSFTAAKNIKPADIQHPTDNRRKVAKVFDLFPNTQGANLKLGVLTHKQKIESLTQVIDAGKFCTFYKDLSFLDKNQKLFRFFVEKGAGQMNQKQNKIEEENSIKVAEEYQFLFEEDPEVIVEETEEPLGNNQMRLTNKSVFTYTDHSTKLQANDTLLFLTKNGEQQGNVYFQKVEFQYSLDQEKKELTIGGNFRQELGRFVKMDIIDEEQIKMMKAIDNEIVEEEFGQTKRGQSSSKGQQQSQSQVKNQSKQQNKSVEKKEVHDEEDDDMEEEEDEGSFEIDSEESLPLNSKKKDVTPTKSYNLREGRKTSQTSHNYQIPAENTASSQKQQVEEEDDNLDDIFGDDKEDKPKQQPITKAPEQQRNSYVVEEEDDDEEEFQFKNDKYVSAGGNQESASKGQGKQTIEKDTFINDDDDEDEEDEDDDDFDHSSDSGTKKGHNSKQHFQYIGSHNSASKTDKPKDDEEPPEEFPL